VGIKGGKKNKKRSMDPLGIAKKKEGGKSSGKEHKKTERMEKVGRTSSPLGCKISTAGNVCPTKHHAPKGE